MKKVAPGAGCFFFVIFAIFCANDFSSLLRHFDRYVYEEAASGFGLYIDGIVLAIFCDQDRKSKGHACLIPEVPRPALFLLSIR